MKIIALEAQIADRTVKKALRPFTVLHSLGKRPDAGSKKLFSWRPVYQR